MTSHLSSASFVAAVSLLSLVSLARAEPAAEARSVQSAEDPSAVAATLGLGPVRASVRREQLLYLALESGGIALVELGGVQGPTVVGRFGVDRRFERLLLAGDTLLVFETRHEVSAFDLSQPRAPAAVALDRVALGALAAPVTAPQPGSAARPVRTATVSEALLRVTEVRAGRAIFEVTRGVVRRGTRVKVISQRLVEKPDLLHGGTTEQPSEEVTAVVELEQVQERRAMARLGRGDVAFVGDLAEPTMLALSERLLFPSRAPFRARAAFFVRPYLGLETSSAEASSKPVGLLVDALAAYYFETIPLALEVSAAPVGFTIGGADSHYPATLSLIAAYSTDFFEIGVGAGALLGRDGPCQPLGSPNPVVCEENDGLTFNQVLRLGALDGLSFTWRSAIFSRPDRFVFGLGRGELAVPLTSRLGLFSAGGGGENGWAFGELGVRTYLGGAGSKGTVIVSASLGYAAIFDGPRNESVEGPSVGLGLEWRL